MRARSCQPGAALARILCRVSKDWQARKVRKQHSYIGSLVPHLTALDKAPDCFRDVQAQRGFAKLTKHLRFYRDHKLLQLFIARPVIDPYAGCITMRPVPCSCLNLRFWWTTLVMALLYGWPHLARKSLTQSPWSTPYCMCSLVGARISLTCLARHRRRWLGCHEAPHCRSERSCYPLSLSGGSATATRYGTFFRGTTIIAPPLPPRLARQRTLCWPSTSSS